MIWALWNLTTSKFKLQGSISPICLPKPKNSWFQQTKKGFIALGVRSQWAYEITEYVLQIKKRTKERSSKKTILCKLTTIYMDNMFKIASVQKSKIQTNRTMVVARLFFWRSQKGPCFSRQFMNDSSSTILHAVWSIRNGILSPKLFWPTVRKNCSSDREKLLKF